MHKKQLAATYYLEHFYEFISFLQSHCGHLLTDRTHQLVAEFQQLNQAAQCVYVRVINRKAAYVRRASIDYTEIDDIQANLQLLLDKNLLQTITPRHIDEWLPTLTKPDLVQLASTNVGKTQPAATPPAKSAKKQLWVDWALTLPKSQIMKHGLVEEYVTASDFELFQYLLFLYFGNLESRLNQFSVRDLGLQPTLHAINHHTAVGHARFESINMATASFQQLKLRNQIRESPQAWQKDSKQFQHYLLSLEPVTGDPAKRYRDQSFYLLGKACLAEDPDSALAFFAESNDPKAIEKRIRLRYGRGENVQAELVDIIDNPANESLLYFAHDFLRQKYQKHKISLLTEKLRQGPEAMPIDPAYKDQVEQGVVDALLTQHQRAFHVENNLWLATFALTFWHELYEHPDSGFASQFDFRPWLIKSGQFYDYFSTQIEATLAKLNNKNRASYKSTILKRFLKHYDSSSGTAASPIDKVTGTKNGLFAWHNGLFEQLNGLLDYVELGALAKVLRKMSQHPKEFHSGFPDLMVFKHNQVHFIEVKAPGDQLRRNQLARIECLTEWGIKVEIQRVEWMPDPKQIYTVVDIETTGGKAQQDKITEIALLKFQGNQLIDQWHSLINPKRPIPPYITAITHITDQLVKHAPTFAEVADEIAAFCQNSIFIAHNVMFDFGFIQHALAEQSIYFNPPKLCTVALARKHLPGLSGYSLNKLSETLKIPLLNHHRALDDAHACANIFNIINEIRINGKYKSIT